MRLYDARGTAASSGGRCCGPRDVEDARAVCAHLGIPLYVVDLAAEFGAAVVDDFVEAYLAGETPNPCVKCNQHIKFTPLLERARAIGADVLVTGHYAQIVDGGALLPRRRCRQGSVVLPVLDAGARARRGAVPARRHDEGRGPRARAAARPAERGRSRSRRRSASSPTVTTPASSRRRRCAAAARCRSPATIVDEDGARARPPRRRAPVHRRPAPRPRQPDDQGQAVRDRRSIRRAARSASARARPPSAASSRSAICAGWRRRATRSRPRSRSATAATPIAADDPDRRRSRGGRARRADGRGARPGGRDLRRRPRARRRLDPLTAAPGPGAPAATPGARGRAGSRGRPRATPDR